MEELAVPVSPVQKCAISYGTHVVAKILREYFLLPEHAIVGNLGYFHVYLDKLSVKHVGSQPIGHKGAGVESVVDFLKIFVDWLYGLLVACLEEGSLHE